VSFDASRSGHIARLVRHRLGPGFGDAVARPEGDLLRVPRLRVLELVRALRQDPDADLTLLVDVCGVDRGAKASGPRFEVHYELKSPWLPYRARLIVGVPEEEPTVLSLCEHYPNAAVYERELFEMYGIYPEGHPGLSPLLLYAGFAGHPLRRDYRLTKAQPVVALGDDSRPVIIDVTERTDATAPAPPAAATDGKAGGA
jgi:NADH-quinone oxidoreductase subunit C